MKLSYLISIAFLLVSCQPGPTEEENKQLLPTEQTAAQPEANEPSSVAEQLLAKTIDAHGGSRYEKAHFGFIFREKIYTFKYSGNEVIYTVTETKDGKTTIDRLENGKLTRTVDGKQVKLNAKETAAASEGLNSVIYFATLPHKLLDPAVNLEKKLQQLSGVATTMS